jgi:hypothetical protein
VNLQQLDELLGEISRAEGLNEFVVIGSLSALGLHPDSATPERMLMSNDVDAYPEIDPDLAFELTTRWGQGSEFEQKHGYYFDAVSPALPTLPPGWESRLIVNRLPSGVTVKFLEPNDAAISKYARGELKDRQWIREGLRSSILSLATIEYRLRETPFLDAAEHDRAKKMVEEDRAWLNALHSPQKKP